ncbi:hypothetical protein Mapa_018532 [Marchantia paleacea]|nr:hypothetical protein Mapa_018532 [Marchantia paleacea]
MRKNLRVQASICSSRPGHVMHLVKTTWCEDTMCLTPCLPPQQNFTTATRKIFKQWITRLSIDQTRKTVAPKFSYRNFNENSWP